MSVLRIPVNPTKELDISGKILLLQLNLSTLERLRIERCAYTDPPNDPPMT